jgi:hypothetical protein
MTRSVGRRHDDKRKAEGAAPSSALALKPAVFAANASRFAVAGVSKTV